MRGGKEGLNKLILLVADVLADAFRDGDDAPLEFHYANSDPVHIEHNIRALGTVAPYRHFFGHGKVVALRTLPINEPYGLVVFPELLPYLHAIAKQPIHCFVEIVETRDLASRGTLQFNVGFIDELPA